MSFLAWLGLFILFSNPPFNDIANPEFGVNEVYIEEDGQWNLTTEILEEIALILQKRHVGRFTAQVRSTAL